MGDVVFTIHIVKKCGLNNGCLLAIAVLLYTYLLKGGSVENGAEAHAYLLGLAARGALADTLQKCCVQLSSFDSQVRWRGNFTAAFSHTLGIGLRRLHPRHCFANRGVN